MDFFEYLHGYLACNDKIKNIFGCRIYPIAVAKTLSYPSIIYSPISTSYDKNLQNESGYTRQIVQFSVYENTFGKARKASRILREVLKDFSGDMHGLKIQAVHSISDNILQTNSRDNFDLEEHVAILEFEFQYNEGE